MQISTLRPGLLVGLKTQVSGNVSYYKRDIEADHATSLGTRRAVWETERTIEDPDEHEKAIQVRGKARTLITRLCAPSSFGLLCPESRRAELDAAIAAAREVADEFNRGAQLTTVAVHVLVGRVAADDLEAVRAINSEVRSLLETMETGIKKLDPKAIRDAATEALRLGKMLTPDASDRVARAIEVARSAATRIAKSGEIAAEQADAQVRIIRNSRNAFLDLSDAVDVARPAAVVRPVDYEPEQQPVGDGYDEYSPAPVVARAVTVRQIDISE